MKYYSIILIFLLPFSLRAQTDTLANRRDSLFPEINMQFDSSLNKTKPLSILHLKSFLNIYKSDRAFVQPDKNSSEDEEPLYDFTEEELNSGFTIRELNAYMKNKVLLNKILMDKYDECWWYRTKSLGEILGIPDMIIKTLMLGLLLL